MPELLMGISLRSFFSTINFNRIEAVMYKPLAFSSGCVIRDREENHFVSFISLSSMLGIA